MSLTLLLLNVCLPFAGAQDAIPQPVAESMVAFRQSHEAIPAFASELAGKLVRMGFQERKPYYGEGPLYCSWDLERPKTEVVLCAATRSVTEEAELSLRVYRKGDTQLPLEYPGTRTAPQPGPRIGTNGPLDEIKVISWVEVPRVWAIIGGARPRFDLGQFLRDKPRLAAWVERTERNYEAGERDAAALEEELLRRKFALTGGKFVTELTYAQAQVRLEWLVENAGVEVALFDRDDQHLIASERFQTSRELLDHMDRLEAVLRLGR